MLEILPIVVGRHDNGFHDEAGLILSFGASCRGGDQDNNFPDITRSKWYKFENLASAVA